MSRGVSGYSNFVFDSQIKIWQQDDVKGISDVLRAITDHYDFSGFCLAFDRQESGDINQFARMHDWPEPWIDEYQHLKLYEKDPHPHLVKARASPYTWNCESFAPQSAAGYVFNVAFQYGLRAGLIIPLRLSTGIHALSLHSSEKAVRHDAGSVMALCLLATTVTDRYLEITSSAVHDGHDQEEKLEALSEIQREMLRWMAIGKTNWEIATILSVPKRTVDYHVASILKKLDVTSRLQAVNIFSRSNL